MSSSSGSIFGGLFIFIFGLPFFAIEYINTFNPSPGASMTVNDKVVYVGSSDFAMGSATFLVIGALFFIAGLITILYSIFKKMSSGSELNYNKPISNVNSKKSCSSCGTRWLLGDKFCSNCGSSN